MKKAKYIAAALALFLLKAITAPAINAQGIYNVFAENETLENVMGLVAAQCDYRFAYNNDIIDTSVKVTVAVSSNRIEEILDAIFPPAGIKYTIIGKQIALSVPEMTGIAKDDGTNNSSQGNRRRTITGHVTDTAGDDLAGAGIYIEGTAKGTFADVNGKYVIEVPDNPETVLTFDFIGMKQVKERIGNRSTINVTMEDEASALEQIVVTGYQTLSRERSAGSFAKVAGAEVRDQANVHGNILRSLEGRATGLNVTESADGVSYLIRGVSSINSKTEPLFIVDGVAMTRKQMDKMVNPNDVESVSFLKDATAASIWGAQAANGVIVIATKTGSSSTELNVSYNGTFTFRGKPDYSYQDMMTSADFIKTAQEIFDPQTYKWKDINISNYGTDNNYRIVFPHEIPMYRYMNGEISLEERDAILNELATSDGRGQYEKYFMSDSYITNHSLAFSGGNERSNYYTSFEYQKEQGAYRDCTDDYKLFFRDRFNLAKWATIDLSLNAFYSKGTSHHSGEWLSKLPYAVFYDKNGNELDHSCYIMTDSYRSQVEALTGISLAYHPVEDYSSYKTTSKTSGINANLGLQLDFTRWLRYEGRFQYAITQGNSETFAPQGTIGVRLERSEGTDVDGKQYLPSSGGHFTMGDNRESAYTVRNQLSFDLSAGKQSDHHITALAGFEFSDRTSGSHSKFLRGYDIQTMQYIFYDDYMLETEGVHYPALPGFASATVNTFDRNSFNQSETVYRFVSMYANGAYTFKDKYSINASVRVDQSNLFGSDPSVQFKPIWSTGVIWNAAKEDFIRSLGWFDRLNVRISYGFSGNSPNPGEGGPYDIMSSEAEPGYSRFGLGYNIVTPANDKLTWEKTRTINFGLDWAVLQGRIGGSIDLYDKNTTDLLAQTPVDPTTGFTTVLSNIGRMTNKGIEFSLQSTNVSSGKFEWTTEFNITYNRNKLVDMYVEPPSTPYSMIEYSYWKGYPYGTVFAYKWAGLDPADGMPRVYDSKGEIVRSISDIDTEEAVHYMGTTVPPVFGSLSNTVIWGNFDLSVMFIYNMGHMMRNDVNGTFSYRLSNNLHNDFAKRWKQPGDEATTNVPAYYSLKKTDIVESDVTFLYRYSDINILSASYIKLRELSLGYRLPAYTCRAMHARSASVHLQASNLATIAFNGEGIDPESHSLAYGARSDRYRPYITASVNIEF